MLHNPTPNASQKKRKRHRIKIICPKCFAFFRIGPKESSQAQLQAHRNRCLPWLTSPPLKPLITPTSSSSSAQLFCSIFTARTDTKLTVSISTLTLLELRAYSCSRICTYFSCLFPVKHSMTIKCLIKCLQEIDQLERIWFRLPCFFTWNATFFLS